MKAVNVKFTTKKGNAFCAVQAKSGQKLNIREAQAIKDNSVQGFLKFDTLNEGGTFRLVYNLNGLVSLSDFLQMVELRKKQFAYLLKNIISVVNAADAAFFSRNLYQFRIDQVMVEPSTWHIFFLYIPLHPFKGEGSLKEVLLDIVDHGNFDPGEDTSYVQEYIDILNAGSGYSESALDQYIHRLEEEVLNGERIGSEHKTISKETEETIHNEDPHYYSSEVSRENLSPKSDGKAIRSESKGSLQVNVDDSNGLVTVFKAGKEQSKTRIQGILDNEALEKAVPIAFLQSINESPPKRYRVNGTAFTIGKQKDNDLTLSVNSVSRHQACIIFHEGIFYLKDQGSTNGTYINGIRLEKDVYYPIKHKDLIGFAKEQFRFLRPF